MCAQILWLWARPLTTTPHRREDLAQASPPHQGVRHLCLVFRQLGKKLRKAYMSFLLSLSPSLPTVYFHLLFLDCWDITVWLWMPQWEVEGEAGQFAIKWGVSVKARQTSFPLSLMCPNMVILSSDSKLSETSQCFWKKKKGRSNDLEGRNDCGKKKKREPFSQGVEGLGVHAAWQNGAKAERGERKRGGVKQINFQHLSSEGNGYPCTGVKEPLHLFSQFKSRKQSNKDIPDEKVTVWQRRPDRAFGHPGATMKP